jgi:hypothetical protein
MLHAAAAPQAQQRQRTSAPGCMQPPRVLLYLRSGTPCTDAHKSPHCICRRGALLYNPGKPEASTFNMNMYTVGLQPHKLSRQQHSQSPDHLSVAHTMSEQQAYRLTSLHTARSDADGTHLIHTQSQLASQHNLTLWSAGRVRGVQEE